MEKSDETKMSALDRAKEKLAHPIAGNNSNVIPKVFDLENLPPQNDDLWKEIRETYSLELDELSALKKYACSGNIYVQHIN